MGHCGEDAEEKAGVLVKREPVPFPSQVFISNGGKKSQQIELCILCSILQVSLAGKKEMNEKYHYLFKVSMTSLMNMLHLNQ